MVKLNSGYDIPELGFGVYQVDPADTAELVYSALKVGYRHIDTAQFYGNEYETAQGILKWLKEGHGKRSDVFLTTKVRSPEGYDEVVESINGSLQKIEGLEYLDLILLHSPMTNKEKRLGSWKAFQEFNEKGLIKSIGVSNYGNHHIKELQDWEGLRVLPAVNQIELHPWNQRPNEVKYDRSLGIEIQAWSPLTQGKKFDDPQLLKLSKKYNKTPAQVLIKWSLQLGNIVLVKSSTQARQLENLQVDDFELSKEELESFKDEYLLTSPWWDPITYQG
ncbi:unnamed protein product [Kuraishia capsulata CBS 1993]|uniref:NADP-dependent oxidoreductase domain-containing protein n=1 Tax=Kuraishia capsulata CBS 1993 TaxID=1382522 RepID=W6MS40_9ASCO|nr:uncharacterized protein KUCA_T00004002001 [Kuraishia capsulata CBS 1993]CDK28022.1 unnamed protein product [Kuraishia capsulata CBS 1993]